MMHHVSSRLSLRLLIVAFGLAATGFLNAQPAGELTVNGGSQAVSTALALTGDGYDVVSGDLGYEGSGQVNALMVYGGGTVTLQSGAEVTVQNSNTLTAFLRVGYGTAGTMTIQSGASLALGSASQNATVQIGQGATGTVSQTGGAVTAIGSFNIGVNGGTGTYAISGGTLTFDDAGSTAANRTTLVSVGFNHSAAGTSTGSFNISGGVVELKPVQPAGDGEASTAIGFVIGNSEAGPGQGTGTVTQTAGTFRVGSGANLYLSGYGGGVYNLNGGTLAIGGGSLQAHYGNSNSAYALNLGGGTIQVNGSALAASVDATLVANTMSTIDTNGLDATWSGGLSAAGLHQYGASGSLLVKTGAGTLMFDGASRGLDSFAVTGGSVGQTAGATTSPEFMVGTGTGGTGTFTMDGGSLTITPSTNSGGTTAVSGSFRVGDYAGTGTFTQNAGTVTMNSNGSFNIGNQGGTGVYNLAGGTLTLAGGLHDLGRTTTTTGSASSGTLNISGGLLELVESNARLILGDREGAGLQGTGVLNQTGGILRITDGNLWLSSRGNGTYDLNGGTLEVGASGLQTFYAGTGSGTGSYAFNLGGGTIKVIGSALTSSANATLTDSTASTLDTNGLGATWSGAFTGTGGLVKTGAGTLVLSGANNVGALTVQAGTVTNGAGTTTAGTLGIGADGASGAAFSLTAGTVSVAAASPSNGELTVGGGSGGDGTLTITGGQLNVGDASNYGRFFVGAYDGTGVVSQSGGTVNTTGPVNIGNRGGTGTYSLSAGTLNAGQFAAANDSNALILGRSRTGQQTNVSKGYLNISGTGSLVLNANTPLQIGGDSGSTAALSEGHVTQSGGTVTVQSSIDIGSKGYGDYSLNGGTLQVGGSAGLTSTSGNYAFNLGGGTLKVINSDLATGVRATLTAASVSTVNTNGFNGTFSNGVTGAGGFTKTGTGTLILGGTSDHTGATTVSAGTLRVDGTVSSSAITVASGATLTGHGTVADVTIQGGGNLNLGGTPGAFTVAGNLTLGGTSYTLLQIASQTAYDYVTVTGALSAGGVLDVDFTNNFSATEGTSFTLFSAGGIDHTFSDVLLPTLASGLAWDTSELYTAGQIAVVASAVPEPAAWGAILGGAALAAVLGSRFRRRRGGERIIRRR